MSTKTQIKTKLMLTDNGVIQLEYQFYFSDYAHFNGRKE